MANTPFPVAVPEDHRLRPVGNRRYELGVPTIVTTNRSLTAWPEIFGEPVIAAAVLDRLLHRAHVFNIKGPSWRLKEHAQLLADRR